MLKRLKIKIAYYVNFTVILLIVIEKGMRLNYLFLRIL